MSPRPRTETGKSSTFICAECGRTFTRAAALGAHRRQAHGIVGASVAAVRARGRTATSRRKASATASKRKTAGRAKASTTARKPTATARKTAAVQAKTRSAAGRTTTNASRRRRRPSTDRRAQVKRDALLRALFPNGIPAREDAIRQLNTWLDEAERLARMR